MFPGRFLEEIDTQMDWNRFLRALQARRIQGIEERRFAAIGEPGKMKPELAALIVEHDKLLAEIDDDG